jgi:hypothetical protein
MRHTLLMSALLLGSFAVSADAATLQSQFGFDSGFGADIGPAVASGSGSVSGGRYDLATGQGLTVSVGATLTSWSVVFSGQLADTSGYRKLMDVAGLASDNGLYNLSGFLNYYNVATGPTAPIVANTDFMTALTFDGTNTTGYVNGVQQFIFATGGIGYPTSLSSIVLFQDDNATGGSEASAGSLDFVQIYDGALTSFEVAGLSGPVSAVPLPATAPILLGALGLFGFMRRRKQT